MSDNFEVDALTEAMNRKASGRTPNTPGSEDPKKRLGNGISDRIRHVEGKRVGLAPMAEDLEGHPNTARWLGSKIASRVPKM